VRRPDQADRCRSHRTSKHKVYLHRTPNPATIDEKGAAENNLNDAKATFEFIKGQVLSEAI